MHRRILYVACLAQLEPLEGMRRSFAVIDRGLRSTVGLTNSNPHLLSTNGQITYRQNHGPEIFVRLTAVSGVAVSLDTRRCSYAMNPNFPISRHFEMVVCNATVLEMFRAC